MAFAVEFAFLKRIALSFGMSELYTTCFFAGKGFFGTLRDKIAFYFSRETESKRKHLALNIIAETVIVFDCPDLAFFAHTYIEYLHNHKQITPQSGELRADDEIILPHTPEQRSQLPLAVGFGSADGLLDPPIDGQVLRLTEVIDFKSLILNSLFVAADPDVTIIHIMPFKSYMDPLLLLWCVRGVVYLYGNTRDCRTKIA